VDGRSKEARLMKSLRTELIAHVGGEPSVTQRILIDQAARLQLRIAMMDREGTDTGMSERRQVEYLAWANTLSRTLRELGLEPAKKPKPRWQPPNAAQPGASPEDLAAARAKRMAERAAVLEKQNNDPPIA
jgi:hypothetical protein